MPIDGININSPASTPKPVKKTPAPSDKAAPQLKLSPQPQATVTPMPVTPANTDTQATNSVDWKEVGSEGAKALAVAGAALLVGADIATKGAVHRAFGRTIGNYGRNLGTVAKQGYQAGKSGTANAVDRMKNWGKLGSGKVNPATTQATHSHLAGIKLDNLPSNEAQMVKSWKNIGKTDDEARQLLVNYREFNYNQLKLNQQRFSANPLPANKVVTPPSSGSTNAASQTVPAPTNQVVTTPSTGSTNVASQTVPAPTSQVVAPPTTGSTNVASQTVPAPTQNVVTPPVTPEPAAKLNFLKRGQADMTIATNMSKSPQVIKDKLIQSGLTEAQALERMRLHNITLP